MREVTDAPGLSAALDAALDVLLEATSDGVVRWASDATARRFEIPPMLLPGRPLAELFHPAEGATLHTLLEGGGEAMLLRRAGVGRWSPCQVRVTRAGGGVMLTGLDTVTDALHSSIDEVGVGWLFVSASSTVAAGNACAAAMLTDDPGASLTGRPATDWPAFDEDGTALAGDAEPSARAIRGQVPVTSQLALQRSTGELAWVALHARPLAGGALITLRDMSADRPGGPALDVSSGRGLTLRATLTGSRAGPGR